MKQLFYAMALIASSHLVCAKPLDAVIAEVNDSVITKSEIETHLQETKTQLFARHMQVPEDAILRKQVLQHLIDVHLQLEVAKNNNVVIDDKELEGIIENIAVQNHLTIEQLKSELVKAQIDWGHYRDNLKKEVLLTRIQQQALGRDIHISEKQVEVYMQEAKTAQIAQQKFHLLNIVIPLSEAPSSQEVTAAKLKAEKLIKQIHAGANFSQLAVSESSDEFALEGGDLGERHLAELPDIFAKNVEEMSINEVRGPIRAPNGWQIIKLVAINDEELHHQITKTHVKHILLKSGPQMTEVEAERSIQNLYRQLRAGKKFDVLAKQYSVDAATAVKGGDMGWVVSTELVPQFSAVMDKLAIGEISEPVKTPFGWHIMQVVERKEEDDSMAFQRQKIRSMLTQKRFEELVKSWQQHLRTEAFVNILDKSFT
jgi:peptidyl-prolyl cis-trans isomerase SurA